eukprot:CAMPEP_0194118418 /NCGR_PEP_ID=MMETSP0150-20130528/35386_1 /TAXON_ID=122233 /ORGANISM="Chaetoceros debilis, Strain MM31A-1" /LENGTH=283 /DNA_ID=CAMNT_0038809781 /DNA_START=67 /DNA_END=918 /DNA_ORIENTATION=+
MKGVALVATLLVIVAIPLGSSLNLPAHESRRSAKLLSSASALPQHLNVYHQTTADVLTAITTTTTATTTNVSRRNLLHDFFRISGAYGVLLTMSPCTPASASASDSAYVVDKVEPDEVDTYAEAQRGNGTVNGNGPLRILWVGAGDMKGVFKNLFGPDNTGNDVIAVDLIRPDAKDIHAASEYAKEHGYTVGFEQGDAEQMKFKDETFDVVVCSMFLCQDFNPEIVVSEIRRVLKYGGRFGFFEHVEDIDKIIVGKIFGKDSVIRVQHYPEMTNIMAGVVRKV